MSKVGVYFGRLPLHNHEVALVVNRNSGLVIPQFHVHYYPTLTTSKDFDSSSLCQARAEFFDNQDTSVALIGQPNLQRFPPIPLQNREANVLAWTHWPLVATLKQKDTLFTAINKRKIRMHISLHKREHLGMKIPLNQGGHPNLMHISLNKREYLMMTLPLDKREHNQTLL